MENWLAIINAVLLVGVTIGIYKNKVDNSYKDTDKISEIDTRLVRIEEKVNFLYLTLKDHK